MRKTHSEETEPVASIAPVASEAEVSAAEVATETISETPEKWFTGSWKGLPNYECVYGDGHATLSLEGAESHWQSNHAPPPEPEPVKMVQLYDRFNNPL